MEKARCYVEAELSRRGFSRGVQAGLRRAVWRARSISWFLGSLREAIERLDDELGVDRGSGRVLNRFSISVVCCGKSK